MSTEEQTKPTTAEAPAAVAAQPAADVEPETTEAALEIVIRKAIEANGVICGVSQVARALDRRTAFLCILATDCEEEQYRDLITALAHQNNIDIIQVDHRTQLAEWVGLVKRDRTGAIKKHFKCSCIAINNFGEQTRALDMLLQQLKE